MVGDTILIKDISINGNNNLTNADQLSETLTGNTINALGIDASSRTIWINGQPYGNAYVNVKEGGKIENPIGGEIFNDFEHNIASGEYSHASGFCTKTTNTAEAAFGKFNQSTKGSTLFSIGDGDSDNSRHNVVEVTENEVNINTNLNIEDDLIVGGSVDINGTLEVAGNTTIGGTFVTGAGTSATGSYSHAEGNNTTAVGNYSHTEGYNTETSGTYDSNPKTVWSGNQSGYFAHAEGNSTIAQGACSHAEGTLAFTPGQSSHAEGYNTTASGDYSHAEGQATTASGLYSHTEGCVTTAQGRGSHAEGIETTANGDYSHAEGHITTANGKYSHVTGSYNTTAGKNSTAHGYYLFDHGVDVENSFIWLMGVSIDNVIIGAGFIRIIQPFIVDPENTVKDPREDHYEVRGSLWVGANKPKIQEVMTYDDTKYYISKSTLDNIISSWNTNTPEQLTSQFRIFEYSEETNKLSPIGGAFRGAALFGDGAEKWNESGSLGKTLYESYITSIKALSTAGAIAIKDAYEEERPNNKPVEFVNNNATIVGQYNKPQPTDIFEVGCGGYDSALKIIQQNAISVKSNGETTIPNLNSEKANIKDLTSTNVTLSTLTSTNANIKNLNTPGVDIGTDGQSINDAMSSLPNGGTECQGFICKDGILFGYTQENFMYLTIDINGKIYLRRRGSEAFDGTGEISLFQLELTDTTIFTWKKVTK